MSKDEHINRLMRDLLIEHIDQKPVPVVFCMQAPPSDRDRIANRHQTLVAAWRREWISFDRHPMPRFSTITEKGREALARCLADWAEAIIGAAAHGSLGRLLPNISSEITEAEKLNEPV